MDKKQGKLFKLKSSQKDMKWLLEILVGLLLILIPLWLVLTSLAGWGAAALELIKGGLVLGVILIGIMFVILGISDVKQ
jgi:hypothetical protein